MTCESTPFRQGLSWARLITVTDQNGVLQNLTGFVIEVEFTTAPGTPAFLSLAVGSGVNLRPDQAGVGKGLAEAHATPGQTMSWPLGLVYFSIVTWPPGQTRDEIAAGTFVVHPAINAP